MLTVTAENQDSEKDIRIFQAAKQYAELYPDDTLDDAYETEKGCLHEGYTMCGRGANHVWVARKWDGKRIVLYT